MSYALRLSEESQIDLKESISYYNKISPELAQQFLEDIIQIIDSIQEQPLIFQERYRNVRIAFANQFPFGIHFIVEASTISVLRILHTKRFFN